MPRASSTGIRISPRLQQRAFLACRRSWRPGSSGVAAASLLRIDAVDANAGGLGEIAEHGAELDARRLGLDRRPACRAPVRRVATSRRRHVEVQRQAVDRRDVAAAVHLAGGPASTSVNWPIIMALNEPAMATNNSTATMPSVISVEVSSVRRPKRSEVARCDFQDVKHDGTAFRGSESAVFERKGRPRLRP